jgi:hypothetical protein
MRRLGSTFVTLWLTFFVPSLIVWGLMLRWSDAAAGRFESVWRWVADRLAFPLLFAPITDWSWSALNVGSAWQATVGFLILTTVWSLMLSAPLIFIGGWWVLIATRSAGGSPTSSSRTDFTSPIDVPYTSAASSLQSPSRAIYLITIPIAMVGVSIKRLFGFATGSSSGLAWATVGIFAVTFLIVGGFMALMFGFSSYWERYDVINRVSDDMWYGYLDTLRIPKIFTERWITAVSTVYAVTEQTQHNDWPLYMGSWYEHEEFRTLVWITAARHGLAGVLLFLIYRVVRRVF